MVPWGRMGSNCILDSSHHELLTALEKYKVRIARNGWLLLDWAGLIYMHEAIGLLQWTAIS